MLRKMMTLIVCVAVQLAVMAPRSAATEKLVLEGDWVSEAPEPIGNGGFRVRQYHIEEEVWEAFFTIYADKEGRQPVYTVRTSGEWEVEGGSRSVKSAHEVVFSVERRSVTILTDDAALLRRFGLADAGLRKGREAEVPEDGLGALRSADDRGVEYDLAAVVDGRLLFGERPANEDMSLKSRRPARLGPPLVPVEGDEAGDDADMDADDMEPGGEE